MNELRGGWNATILSACTMSDVTWLVVVTLVFAMGRPPVLPSG